MTLETIRLLLRPITPDDLTDLLAIWGNPDAMRFFPKTLDRDEMKAWIERVLARYEQCGFGVCAVIEKQSGQFVGDCGLYFQEVEGVEELEVLYHFNPQHWGQGYATEAARACMDFAFAQLGRKRIISMIRPENLPSRRVAERNGLQIEKEIFWRGYQHFVYALEKP